LSSSLYLYPSTPPHDIIIISSVGWKKKGWKKKHKTKKKLFNILIHKLLRPFFRKPNTHHAITRARSFFTSARKPGNPRAAVVRVYTRYAHVWLFATGAQCKSARYRFELLLPIASFAHRSANNGSRPTKTRKLHCQYYNIIYYYYVYSCNRHLRILQYTSTEVIIIYVIAFVLQGFFYTFCSHRYILFFISHIIMTVKYTRRYI